MRKKRAAPEVPIEVLQYARACTPQQRAFAENLLRDPKGDKGDKTRAARSAGAKFPKQSGIRWMRHPKVRRYMDALLREAQRASAAGETPPSPAPAPDELALAPRVHAVAVGVQELLENISDEIRVDMADFISVEVKTAEVGGDALPAHGGVTTIADRLHTAVYFDWHKAVARGKTHLIKEITWNKWGHPCVKLVDKQAAEGRMAQILGLLHEPEKADDPMKMAAAIAALSSLPPETLRQVHRALLSQGPVIDLARSTMPEVTAANR